MTEKRVVDAQRPASGRRMVRASERVIRVRLACEALVAEGKPFRFADVATRAEMAASTLFRYPELQEIVNKARVAASERAAAEAAFASRLRAVRSVDADEEDLDEFRLVERGELPGPDELSVAELAGRYVSGRVHRGELSSASGKVAETRLTCLLSRCGHLSPRALDRPMLLRWQATIGKLAPTTRRSYIGEIQRFCRWLVVEGLIPSDPSAALVRPREPRRAPRALAHKQVAELLASLPDPERLYQSIGWESAAIALMLGCGLRCVEVSRLDLADYNEWEQTLTVHGKGGHQRVLPIPTASMKALDRYIAERGTAAGPMFLATGSKAAADGRLSPAWVSKRTARLMAEAGVHKPGDGRSAHALRHTAASDVLDRCHDVRTVQQMLGHASLATTQIYLRSADLGTLREAMSGRDYAESAR